MGLASGCTSSGYLWKSSACIFRAISCGTMHSVKRIFRDVGACRSLLCLRCSAPDYHKPWSLLDKEIAESLAGTAGDVNSLFR